MPILELKISGPENAELAKQLAAEISGLTKRLLNRKPELTAVTVSFIQDYLWFVDNISLAELQTKSFHLNIKISDSTNLKQQKAGFIKAVHNSMNTILGGIHPVSYIVIHEMKGDAYGYEGLTMEYKFINTPKE